nr:MAG TPA: tail protein [Caudoviricetes sp.]
MTDVLLGHLFPRFLLEDRNGRAMAEAIRAALTLLCGTARQGLSTVTDVKSMPEWRLDEMAWELAAAWYDYDAELSVKRAQIASALEFYNRLGTPYAVVSALGSVFGDGFVQEWYEYGGQPYHFKAYTTNTDALTENKSKFLALLSAVKNLRSVLDSLNYYGAEGQATFYTAAKAIGAECSVYAVARLY